MIGGVRKVQESTSAEGDRSQQLTQDGMPAMARCLCWTRPLTLLLPLATIEAAVKVGTRSVNYNP